MRGILDPSDRSQFKHEYLSQALYSVKGICLIVKNIMIEYMYYMLRVFGS